MGNFERNLPIFLKDIEAKILSISTEKYKLDWGHECDCEFCTEDQDVPQETEKRAGELDKQLADLHLLKKRLIGHAKLHCIKIPEEKSWTHHKVNGKS